MTSELEDLAAAVRNVLDRRWSDAALRTAIDTPAGYDTGLWSVLSDQVGVAALAVPEAAGGMGAGVRALQSVAEELGRRLVPSPFLGSAVLATSVLNGTGACDLLGDLASGTRTATVAFAGRAFTDRPLIMSGGRVSGTACFVLDGDTADDLLLAARDGRLVLLRADRGVAHRRHTPTLDPTRRLAEVTVDRASGTVLLDDAEAALAHALDVTCAVLAAEQVGAAEHALRSTVEYTRSRVQFGRAIGSFQALKHRMADMFVLVEAARSAAYAAGESLDRADPDAPQAVATAKAYCSEAFQAVAAEMIQLHGGIGITWEHDAHLYFKRAHGSAHLFGDPASFLALRPLTHS